jgi:hypothetical protein
MQVAVIEAVRFHVKQQCAHVKQDATHLANDPPSHHAPITGEAGACAGGGGSGEHTNRHDVQHNTATHAHFQHTHAPHKSSHKGKGKGKGYHGESRKEQKHLEFELEDQRWLGAIAPMLATLLHRSDVNAGEDALAVLLPLLTQVSQARDELLYASCVHLQTLLGCRKVVFMEVDASNNFAVASTSDPGRFLPPDPEKFPGGHGILALNTESKPIKPLLMSGAALEQAFAASVGGLPTGQGDSSDAGRRGRRKRDELGKEVEGQLKKQQLQRLGHQAWKELLGPADPQSAISCACLDERSRLYGAFVAVDHRVDALPHENAMDFNQTHSRMLENVASHVASLLTHNEESTAKSEQIKCSNELIFALQDLALCTHTERMFDMVRTRFPRLTGVQDMTLFMTLGAGREQVLYSEESRARYEPESHLHALFSACPTSAQRDSGRITSTDVLQCLEMLRIVPARIKTEQLYSILAAAKMPIQRASRAQASGLSQRRQDDIDIVRFKEIFETIAAHLGTAMHELLRTSDPNAANFCLPQRNYFRFPMASLQVGNAAPGTGMRGVPVSQETTLAPASSGGKARRGSETESKARFGIAVHVARLAEDVIIAHEAYKHHSFCPEVDWPQMLMHAQEAAATLESPEVVQLSTALHSVCSLPLLALLPNGLPETPPRVLGVLQAANKRNSCGFLSASGFLETDVSQVRIVARTGTSLARLFRCTSFQLCSALHVVSVVLCCPAHATHLLRAEPFGKY